MGSKYSKEFKADALRGMITEVRIIALCLVVLLASIKLEVIKALLLNLLRLHCPMTYRKRIYLMGFL